jgi:hypothetical protein
MAEISGDNTSIIVGLVDDGSAVTFNVNVNGDLFGSNHYGNVVCDREINKVQEERVDGGGRFDGSAAGRTYHFETHSGSLQGVHYLVQLHY